MDAHLVLDRAADDAVARAERAVVVDRNFGTRNSEMPFTPAGAPSIRASTRWMMLSARSCSPAEMKIFWPVMAKEPSSLRVARGLDQAEIGAAMRLGQVHRAGPFARRHLRQVGLLRARRRRASSSAAAAPLVRPGYMAKARLAEIDVFAQRDAEEMRQALAAIFRGAAKCRPSRPRHRPCRPP